MYTYIHIKLPLHLPAPTVRRATLRLTASPRAVASREPVRTERAGSTSSLAGFLYHDAINVYIYIYIYICTHIIHILASIIRLHIHAYIYIYIDMSLSLYTYIYIYIYIHIYPRTCTVCKQTFPQTQIKAAQARKGTNAILLVY